MKPRKEAALRYMNEASVCLHMFYITYVHFDPTSEPVSQHGLITLV